jgi:ankyrin repeat protein
MDKRMPLFAYAAQNWCKHALEAPDHSVYHEILAFLHNDAAVYSANHAMESDWQYLKTFSGVKMPKLVLAAHFGLLSIVEALLQQGEDINATGTINMTALSNAVKHKWKALVLQNGADVDICHIQDGPPLHMAILNGDDTIVSQILEKHLNLEAQDSVEQTPLDIAVAWGHLSIVELLLAAGVRPDLSLLKLAAVSSAERKVIVRLLVAKISNMAVQNEDGETILVLAAKHGNEALVEAVLEKPSDQVSQDNKVSAIQAAISSRNELIAQTDLEAQKAQFCRSAALSTPSSLTWPYMYN